MDNTSLQSRYSAAVPSCSTFWWRHSASEAGQQVGLGGELSVKGHLTEASVSVPLCKGRWVEIPLRQHPPCITPTHALAVIQICVLTHIIWLVACVLIYYACTGPESLLYGPKTRSQSALAGGLCSWGGYVPA